MKFGTVYRNLGIQEIPWELEAEKKLGLFP